MSFNWPSQLNTRKLNVWLLKSVDNAITSLNQIDEVLDILQGKKEYTNGDLVAMVLVVAEMEKIADVLEQKEKEILQNSWKLRSNGV